MTGLAGDGRCKTFDQSADGFGRSEGSGAAPELRVGGMLRVWSRDSHRNHRNNKRWRTKKTRPHGRTQKKSQLGAENSPLSGKTGGWHCQKLANAPLKLPELRRYLLCLPTVLDSDLPYLWYGAEVILRLQSTASGKGESGLSFTRGSCVNQDGRSATITAPSGPAQQRALQNSLRDSELSALEVSLVECHGAGTALGDPIEVGAQEKIYGKERLDQEQLVLSAAKSVIAHLEGAAVAGIAKLVLVLEHKPLG